MCFLHDIKSRFTKTSFHSLAAEVSDTWILYKKQFMT